MGETWQGLYPITAFVRDALRKKVEASTIDGLSSAENTLLTACEFWFAVNTDFLAKELSNDVVLRLMRAQEAFARLGAVRVASTLRAAVAQITRDQEPISVPQTLAHIEQALARTEDRVDEIIARFAVEKMDVLLPTQ